MSDTANSTGSDAGTHFTVEDSGSTSDAADLVHDDETIASSQAGSIGRTAAASDAAASQDGSRSEVVSESQVTSGSQAGSDPGAPSAPGAPEPPQAPTGGRAPLVDDDSPIGHVFDQTNGVIEGIDGDSDGTAASDVLDTSERADGSPSFRNFASTEAGTEAGAEVPDENRVTGD